MDDEFNIVVTWLSIVFGGMGLTVLLVILSDPSIKKPDWLEMLLPKRSARTWFRFVASNCDTIMRGRFLERQKRYVGVYRGYEVILDMDSDYSHLYLRQNHQEIPETVPESTWLTAPLTPDKMIHHLAPHGLPDITGQLIIESKAAVLLYKESHLLKSHKQLQRVCDLLSDLAYNYPALLALEGEAMPAVQDMLGSTKNYILTKVAIRLAIDIANKTTAELEGKTDRWLCPTCLTRCIKHPVNLHVGKSVSYYGCRVCHQSRNLLNGLVVMRLDKEAAHPVEVGEGVIYLNWSVDQRLADFSRVHIMQADDVTVEHFAVQVGNDTDPFRAKLYKQAICYISPHCNLSPGTIRILGEFFGEVTRR